MLDRVLSLLHEVKPTVDFQGASRLFASGALDSFDLVVLVGELRQAFQVNFAPDDLTPENFDSADSIVAMLLRKQRGA